MVKGPHPSLNHQRLGGHDQRMNLLPLIWKYTWAVYTRP